MLIFHGWLLLLLAPFCYSSSTYEDYSRDRVKFFQHEDSLSINAAWELTPEEKVVDRLLEQLKEADRLLDPVPVQFSFISMRTAIDNSNLYSFVETIPKGALLHSHDVSSQDMHFYVEMSYMNGCLYNVDDTSSDYGDLSFRPGPNFVPIETIRNSWPDGVASFDEALYRNFTITQYEDVADTTGDFLWDQFQPIFSRLHGAYQYAPVFREYYRRMFPKLLADGVSRWEMRTSLEPVYDSVRTYTQEETLGMVLEELHAWQQEECSPAEAAARQAFSFGLIMQGIRSGSPQEVVEALSSAYALREVFPELVLGFDLVGHEDPGQTLYYWAPILIDAQETLVEKCNCSALPFFFHAGESNRESVQDNLVDAVLLNTSRIGHGFGIQAYPSLWPLINAKHVLIESCPISNQLLGMVVDQRNHPVGQMLHHVQLHARDAYPNPDAGGARVLHTDPAWLEMQLYDPRVVQVMVGNRFRAALPVSINNDDPGFWGIDAVVSYDWYVAVLGWDLSVAGIKQLAVDSIVRCGAPVHIRTRALLDWDVMWGQWIKTTARAAGLGHNVGTVD